MKKFKVDPVYAMKSCGGGV